MAVTPHRSLPLVDEGSLPYHHPLYETLISAPGLSVAVTAIDRLLTWGLTNSLWVFPMATSCCGIELMAAAASLVDLDRMGTIMRGTPRQGDVMVIAGTITVKMAPRVKTLWEQMPQPRWAIAMGSCAISGDFYRNLYPVVPGIDTVLPVDVYIPGCPPNPEALMHGLLRLQERVRMRRTGGIPLRDENGPTIEVTRPSIARVGDPDRDATLDLAQESSALTASSLDRGDDMNGDTLGEDPTPRGELLAMDVQELLRAHGVTEFCKDASPVVPVDRHVALATKLRDAGFTQFVYVVATHFEAKSGGTPRTECYEVAYALRAPGKSTRLVAWRLILTPASGEAGGTAEARVPTLVGVFAGADWQEREQYDLVGVRFEGHPDMRRIMMPEGWSGHPLRRDYPADTACAPWR